MAQSGFDFAFLKQQMHEGIIVEDPETLADLALLVPELANALEQVKGEDDHVASVLNAARDVIMRHCAT